MGNALRRFRKAASEEISFLKLLMGHRNTPWAARVLLGGAIAYAVSPIDLIPDWIPLVGHLDDLVVVPAMVGLAWTMIPRDVIADCRERSRRT